MMYLMSIDTGTQSTRVSLIDENGNEVASASRNQKLESPQPGWGGYKNQASGGITLVLTLKKLLPIIVQKLRK